MQRRRRDSRWLLQKLSSTETAILLTCEGPSTSGSTALMTGTSQRGRSNGRERMMAEVGRGSTVSVKMQQRAHARSDLPDQRPQLDSRPRGRRQMPKMRLTGELLQPLLQIH